MVQNHSRIAVVLLVAAALSGCRSAYTAFGNFPGETCADPDSVRMITVNYNSYKKALAERTPPVFKPVLLAVEDPTEVPVDPNAPEGDRHYCQGTAVFDDGTREPVFSSWSRSWEPNLVSGPHFSWCIGAPNQRCGRAIAPSLMP